MPSRPTALSHVAAHRPLARTGVDERGARCGTAPQPRARPAEKDSRIAGQPAFVLHSYPYKETSLIVDVFSRDHGRIALVAKGAKRPHSKLRGVLQTFQPLSVGWSGKVRSAHADRRRMGGRLAAAGKIGAAVRLLPERTAGQAAGARRSASGAVRPLCRDPEPAGAR